MALSRVVVGRPPGGPRPMALIQAAYRALWWPPKAKGTPQTPDDPTQRRQDVLDALAALVEDMVRSEKSEITYKAAFIIPPHCFEETPDGPLPFRGYPRQEREGNVMVRLTYDDSHHEGPAGGYGVFVSYPYGYAGHVARGIATYRDGDLDIQVAKGVTPDRSVEDLHRVLVEPK